MTPPEPSKQSTNKDNLREDQSRYVTSAALGNVIFVKCDINQHSVNALVDTGAAVTIIHLDVFNKTRVGDSQMWSSHQWILRANNHPLDIRGATEIKIRNTYTQQPLAYLPNLLSVILVINMPIRFKFDSCKNFATNLNAASWTGSKKCSIHFTLVNNIPIVFLFLFFFEILRKKTIKKRKICIKSEVSKQSKKYKTHWKILVSLRQGLNRGSQHF